LLRGLSLRPPGGGENVVGAQLISIGIATVLSALKSGTVDPVVSAC
jgi:hypothetical protein